MGDDDGDAEEQVVGVVHEERLGRGLEAPESAGPRQQHRDGAHGNSHEPGEQGLSGRARDNRGKHQHDGTDPTTITGAVLLCFRHQGPVKRENLAPRR